MNVYAELLVVNITEVGVEAASGWCLGVLREPEMPLADHVSGVAGLFQLVGHGRHFKRNTAGLARPDDEMLETRFSLQHTQRFSRCNITSHL